MSECIVCYENQTIPLTSMCPLCQNAFVCEPCQHQWRQACIRQDKHITCPKCRGILEERRVQVRRWIFPASIAAVTLGPVRDNTMSPWLRAVVLALTLFLYALPIITLIALLSVLPRSTQRTIKRILVPIIACSGLLFLWNRVLS
jgi:hypothetical protein